MTIDICFCKKVIDDGISLIREHSITDEFMHGKGLEVFEFITSHFTDYGDFPDVITILREVGVDLNSFSAPEPSKYYADKLIKRHITNLLTTKLKAAVNAITNNDTDKTLQLLQQGVIDVSTITQQQNNTLVDLTKTGDDRFLKYIEGADIFNSSGVESPWPPLDEMTGGFRAGEFWLVLAGTKIGKSFLSIIIAIHSWRMGKKVLLVTMENSIDLMAFRFDSMVSKQPVKAFRHGSLGYFGEEKYLASLTLTEESDTPIYFAGDGGIKNVVDIELIVREKEIDLVVVDGVYLMNAVDRRIQKPYERMAVVAGEMTRLPLLLKIPVIATSQYNRELKEGSLKGSVHKTGFAYALSQNAHGILSLLMNEDLKDTNRRILEVTANRSGELGALMLEWDLEAMSFDYIGEVEYDNLIPDKKFSKKSPKKTGGNDIVPF